MTKRVLKLVAPLALVAASLAPWSGTAGGQEAPGCDDGLAEVDAPASLALLADGPLISACVSGTLVVDASAQLPSGLVIVDSVVLGGIDARAARFQGPFNLRGTTVHGEVLLDNGVFQEDVILRDATFEARVSAPATQFRRMVDMEAAAFRQGADFSGARFLGPVLARELRSDVSTVFRRASFGDKAAFDLARLAGADFESATFAADAEFDRAVLSPGENGPLARFRTSIVEGRMSFAGANFVGDTVLHLDNLQAAALDLAGADLDATAQLRFNRATVASLYMDLGDTSSIDTGVDARRDDRIEALRLLVSTAEDDGEQARANAAEYTLRQVEARRMPLLVRVPYIGVGEYMFGYFLKPLNPAITLLCFFPIAVASHAAVEALAARSWRGIKPAGMVALTWRSLFRRAWSMPVGWSPVRWRKLRLACTGLLVLERLFAGVLVAAFAAGAAQVLPPVKEVIDAIF